MGYKVSFCIPEYNCREAAEKLVKSLLEFPSDEIQIVVSDNKSTDGTYEVLNNFHDKRLVIIQNNENIGPKLNWYNALENGGGEWLYLVMGRDRLNPSKIPVLLKKLDKVRKLNVGVFVDRKINHNEPYLVYRNKREAAEEAVIMDHPTGIVVRRDSYRSIIDRKDLFSTESTYPEVNLILAIMKNEYLFAKGWSGVFIYQDFINKSTFTSNFAPTKDEKKLFFHPINRTINTICVAESVRRLNLSNNDYNIVFRKIMDDYVGAFIGWKTGWCEDTENMRHYGLSRRVVKLDELRSIMEEVLPLFDRMNPTITERMIIQEAFEKLSLQIDSFLSEDQLYREKTKRDIVERLVRKCKCEYIKENFERRGIHSVAVYGYGDVGASFCEMLINSGVEVKYAIDRYARNYYSGIDLYAVDDEWPTVDAIIISVIENGMKVKEFFLEKYKHNAPIILFLEDIVFGL